MAIFTIIEEKYFYPSELENLIVYVLKYSKRYFTANLYDIDTSLYANQMLYVQNCSGKHLHSRAQHFVISFDSYEWEWEIGEEELEYFTRMIINNYFKPYQIICGIHKGDGGWHAHIIVNPVSVHDYKLLHWSSYEYQRILWQLAVDLYMTLGGALQGVSYIDEQGKVRKSNCETDLYKNRYCKSVPLRNNDGSIAVVPYMNGLFKLEK